MQKWEVAEGNLASPQGFRGAAVAAGIKKSARRARLGTAGLRRPGGHGSRRVHHQPGGRRARARFAPEPRRKPRTLPRPPGQRRKCQRLHGPAGPSDRKRERARGRQAVEPPARAGSGGFHGRYRRASRFGPGHHPASRAGRKAFRRERLGGGARHHDHRHIPQVMRPALGGGRKIRAPGGNRQGRQA